MQTTQGNVLRSLRNVQSFLDEHADKLAGVIKTGTRQRLDDIIVALSAYLSDQTGGLLAAKGSTQKQHALRQALLRDHMAPINRIAKVELPHTPELTPLLMPKGKPTLEKLAAAAYGMAETAAPHAAVFTGAGLPDDFITQLTGAANAMIASLGERSASRGKRRGATSGLKADLTAGRKIVHVLDTFVRSALKDDPALLANWNLVKRVEKVPGRAAGTVASPATTPTPPVPVPTPAPAVPTTATASVASTTSTPAAHTAPA
jgi:hypothetical protein